MHLPLLPDRFSIDFGSILESILEPKINNFGYRFCVYCVRCFLSLSDGFGVDFRAILVSKSDKNAKYRYMRNRCFMFVKTMFLKFGGVNPGSKCVQNWSRDSKTFRA